MTVPSRDEELAMSGHFDYVDPSWDEDWPEASKAHDGWYVEYRDDHESEARFGWGLGTHSKSYRVLRAAAESVRGLSQVGDR